MTNDGVVDYLISEGYDYDVESREWMYGGETAVEREVRRARAGEKEISKLPGFSKAMSLDKPSFVEADLERAYERARTKYEEVDSLRDLKEYESGRFFEEARFELGTRAKYADQIEKEVGELNIALDKSFIESLHNILREVKTEEDLRNFDRLLESEPSPAKRLKTQLVLGVGRERGSYQAAKDRIERRQRRQQQFLNEVTPGKALRSAQTSVKTWAEDFDFGTGEGGKATPRDIQRVAELFREKGIPIKETARGLSVDKSALREQLSS